MCCQSQAEETHDLLQCFHWALSDARSSERMAGTEPGLVPAEGDAKARHSRFLGQKET